MLCLQTCVVVFLILKNIYYLHLSDENKHSKIPLIYILENSTEVCMWIGGSIFLVRRTQHFKDKVTLKMHSFSTVLIRLLREFHCSKQTKSFVSLRKKRVVITEIFLKNNRGGNSLPNTKIFSQHNKPVIVHHYNKN